LGHLLSFLVLTVTSGFAVCCAAFVAFLFRASLLASIFIATSIQVESVIFIVVAALVRLFIEVKFVSFEP